ncbi:MAG: ATP-binding protein [Bdellovibrionota bacterium]
MSNRPGVATWQLLFALSLVLVVAGCLGIVYYGSHEAEEHLIEMLVAEALALIGLALGCIVLARFGRREAEQADRLARTEHASHESEAKLQLAIQSMGIAVWEWEARTQLVHCDSRIFELYGDDPGSAPYMDMQTWLDRVHVDDRPMAERMALEAVQSGHFSMRFRIFRRDGTLRHLRLLARTTYDSNRKPLRMSGIMWDITDDVLAHEIIESQRTKLAVSARLASLGEMAGGIAHEINNPLQIIVGHAAVMNARLARGEVKPDEIATSFNKISATADRISRIVKGLRTVARDGDHDPFQVTAPVLFVNDAMALCSEKMRRHDIKIDVDLAALDDVYIPCRSVQISQVILNLLTNAYHAVEVVAGEKWIRVESAQSTNWIEIAVVDSGGGVPATLKDKIFQPFFTTKEVGVGTGLGLSLSLSIARDHGGTIELDTTCANTRFVLRLPRTQAHQTAA